LLDNPIFKIDMRDTCSNSQGRTPNINSAGTLEKVKVIVRCRPMSESEKADNYEWFVFSRLKTTRIVYSI